MGVIIYTDGACQGNGKDVNKGGFGVVVLDNDENLLYNTIGFHLLK